MILVDTNIIVDATMNLDSDAARALREAIMVGAGINQIILAELAGGLHDPNEVFGFVPSQIKRLPIPWEAAPIAARAFGKYRKTNQGPKVSPLPDFYIGAHAEVENLQVLTSDKGRYATYFPTIDVHFP